MITDWIMSKFNRDPKPITWTDPQHGTEGVAVVLEDKQELEILSTPKPQPSFGKVTCLSASAFCAYLNRHASRSSSIVFANENGLFAIADYCSLIGRNERPVLAEGGEVTKMMTPIILETPDEGKHRISMPAEWSPDCVAAMKKLELHAGKWISLDDMETFLDVAAPFIKDVLKVRDVLLDLEGAELVSAKRTATGSRLEIGATVQAKENRNVPGSMVFAGAYMGQAVVIDMPLRVRVQSRAIQFLIVDNGAIRKAKMEAVSQAAQAVRAAGWFVTEGSIA